MKDVIHFIKNMDAVDWLLVFLIALVCCVVGYGIYSIETCKTDYEHLKKMTDGGECLYEKYLMETGDIPYPDDYPEQYKNLSDGGLIQLTIPTEEM